MRLSILFLAWSGSEGLPDGPFIHIDLCPTRQETAANSRDLVTMEKPSFMRPTRFSTLAVTKWVRGSAPYRSSL